MARCVIVGGAEIRDYAAARAYFRDEDFYIFCDSGYRHAAALGVTPDLIVGDFDSSDDPHASAETIVLPRAKDDTDTVFAAREALRRGFDDFLLLGVLGGRLDHTLANLSILLWLDTLGINALAVDAHSEVSIVSHTAVVEPCFSFFSLLNISGLARGVTIKNARFPLEDAEIGCDYAYAVSNECLPGLCAEISVKEGRLLLVKDF